MRAIAAGSLARDPQFPDLPTVAESGFPDSRGDPVGRAAHHRRYAAGIVERLNAEVNRAIREPELIAKLAALRRPAGGRHVGGVSEADRERNPHLTETARAAGIKAE